MIKQLEKIEQAQKEENGWECLGETRESIWYWNENTGEIVRVRDNESKLFKPLNLKNKY